MGIAELLTRTRWAALLKRCNLKFGPAGAGNCSTDLSTGIAELLTRIRRAARLKHCNLKFGLFQDAGPKRAADERWLVQSTHQRGTCRVGTGRDGERSVSHEHILIFRFMCADHAVRHCKSAGNNPERSRTPGMDKFLKKMEKV
jgi:hypothetical protein